MLTYNDKNIKIIGQKIFKGVCLMRTVKKLLATVLAVLTIFSVCVFSASAVSAPEFKVTLVSETATTATIRFSLVKGSFNSLDATFSKSSDLTECTAITPTTAFSKVATATTNSQTGMISCIAISAVKAPMDVCELTFKKKSSASVDERDFGVVVTSCSVTVNSGVSGADNVEVGDDVTVKIDFGSFNLNQDSIQMNYKQTVKVDYTTNYKAEDLTWTSSNEKVATVDEDGNVYASGKGNATITVKSADGKVNETVNVTVSYTVLQWIIIIVLFGWIWY